MNHALNSNYIPGFDNRLNNNFNHLLFTEDFIVVSKAFSAVAKACLACLHLYQQATSQMANLNKSTIHLPSWCNKKIDWSISTILRMKPGSFPFKYFGVPINPNWMAINYFQFLIDRTTKVVNAWNHS